MILNNIVEHRFATKAGIECVIRTNTDDNKISCYLINKHADEYSDKEIDVAYKSDKTIKELIELAEEAAAKMIDVNDISKFFP